MTKLSELEKKQNKCLNLFDQLYLKGNDRLKEDGNTNS